MLACFKIRVEYLFNFALHAIKIQLEMAKKVLFYVANH